MATQEQPALGGARGPGKAAPAPWNGGGGGGFAARSSCLEVEINSGKPG